jgi:hypothetical protein
LARNIQNHFATSFQSLTERHPLDVTINVLHVLQDSFEGARLNVNSAGVF